MHAVTAGPGGFGWRIHSFTNTQTGRLRNLKFLARYLKSRLHPFTAEWRKARRHMLAEKHRNIAEWQKVKRTRPKRRPRSGSHPTRTNS